MPKSNSPATTAATNEDNDLPMTAVRPRQKDLLIQQLQDKLAEQSSIPEVVPQEHTSTDPEEATFKKRYSDLRRYAAQKEEKLAEEVAELKNQINQLNIAQNQPLPKTREEFEAWKAKYPDIVGFIEIIAEERANAAKAQVDEELSTVRDKLSKTEKEKAFATLKTLVPDLDSILGSKPYINWFNGQPHFIQDVLNTSDDPHQISYYLNIYKTTLEPTVMPNKADKLKALNTSVRNTGISPDATSGKWKYTQSQISKMSMQEYEANEVDIIAARNSGKILDDLSKRNTVFD